MVKTKNFAFLILFVAFLSLGGVTEVFATPFQNGDFGTGYKDWNGALFDGHNFIGTDPNTDPSHFGLYHSTDPNFSWVANIHNDSTYPGVFLYQDFLLNRPSPGWTVHIKFWIRWEPTNGIKDYRGAWISDSSGTNIVDLLNGVN